MSEEQREVLDQVTEEHGYPTGEVEVGQYLAGHVDRDNELILVRMGNDDGTILESPLLLEEAQSMIRALESNVIELTQVIDLHRGETGGRLGLLGDAVSEAVDEGDYPVMQLLVRWVDSNDLWADFASWASEIVDQDELERLNAMIPDDKDDDRGWTNGGI